MSKKRLVFGPYSANVAIRFQEATNHLGQLYLKTNKKAMNLVGVDDLAAWDDPRISAHFLPANHVLHVVIKELNASEGELYEKRYQFVFRQIPSGGAVAHMAVLNQHVDLCEMIDCNGSDTCEPGEEAVCMNNQVQCVPMLKSNP